MSSPKFKKYQVVRHVIGKPLMIVEARFKCPDCSAVTEDHSGHSGYNFAGKYLCRSEDFKFYEFDEQELFLPDTY